MSRRRYPLRSAAVASRSQVICSESNSSDDDDDDFGLFETLVDLYQSRSMPRNRKRKAKYSTTNQECTSGTTSQSRARTSRGRGVKTRGTVNKTKGSRMTTSQSLTPTQVGCSGKSVSDWESDYEIIEEDVKSSHQKDIQNKVDNFFKSGNLISDDDDDLNLVKTTEKQPPKEPKEFYLLSDSDDELTTQKDNSTCLKTELTVSESNPVEIISSNTTSDKDELMDIVDKILDCDDVPLEVDTQPDMSWTEYKSKREEILGSVKALLGELGEPLGEPLKDNDKNVQKSPEKSKPSCPICLEILGGNVVAASTMCGHIFCQVCIKKVAKSTKICPTCRKRINLKQIHPLYL